MSSIHSAPFSPFLHAFAPMDGHQLPASSCGLKRCRFVVAMNVAGCLSGMRIQRRHSSAPFFWATWSACGFTKAFGPINIFSTVASPHSAIPTPTFASRENFLGRRDMLWWPQRRRPCVGGHTTSRSSSSPLKNEYVYMTARSTPGSLSQCPDVLHADDGLAVFYLYFVDLFARRVFSGMPNTTGLRALPWFTPMPEGMFSPFPKVQLVKYIYE